MKGMLIPTNGNPVEIDIEVDETGSTLHDLQRLVGGNIEPFDVIFGEGISLYVNEMSRVADYFTEVSKPGSGIEEVIAIRMGQRREEARSEDGRVTLKGEAQASRAASEKLAEGRDTGSPARDDHSIV